MAEMQLDGAPAGVVAPRLQDDDDKQPSLPPVAVHVIDGNGYVWDADDARRLRQDHRIIGAMVGAVAGFKQQNAASGLPLRLLPEELGLALDSGWARGYRLRGEGGEEGERGGVKAATGAADPFRRGDGGGGGGAGLPKSGRGGGEGRQGGSPPSWRAALAHGTHFTLATAAPESLRVYFDDDDDDDDDAAGSGSSAAAAANSGKGDPLKPRRPSPGSRAANSGKGDPLQRPRPGSRAAASQSVFRDLHSRGYCLTPGSNFGAHWLAYPSDPMLYHAQLCVRVCCSGGGDGEEEGKEEEGEDEGEEGEEGQEERRNDGGGGGGSAGANNSAPASAPASSAPLCPTLLAAASRGAHAARKHLLLAYPNGGGWREERVHYLTIAPEAGFGS